MKNELHTSRLLLRPLASGDSKALFAYRSDALTNQYQGWIPKTKDEVDSFIANLPNEFNHTGTWYQLAIETKDQHKVIGDIGVHFMDEWQCELGCTLSLEYHGLGYATEAMRTLISFLFNELNKHRITASVDPMNTASIKLVERLGFRKEAHFKESLLINGEWVDDVVYALLKKEWK